jgi:glutamate/tyrosine decarboxylase-like PLP-dependent enzyme
MTPGFLERTLDEIRAHERAIAEGPLVPDVAPSRIRDGLASRYDFAAPMPIGDVVADVERMMRTWHVQVTHPRYFGLFNPSVTPASIVADLLTAMYNPQLATWRTSPAANEIERHTLRWLASRFGIPLSAASSFTTGGAEANLTAVVAALTRAYPEYGEDGARALQAPPAIYLSADAHDSFHKIAHVTGIGRRALRFVATDRGHRLDVADLARLVNEDRRRGLMPLMVVATAGTTALGAIDPLWEIARFCRSRDLWFHVDASWGGAAVLSPRLRHHFDGIDAADSIACDAHKWFSVPIGAGMFFCRHADVISEAFHARAQYMPPETGAAVDPYTTSVQWSRRFIGLKLFLSLAECGEAGYVERIEHQTRMGEMLRRNLIRDGWRIVNDTPLPLVCVARDGLVPGRFLEALYRQQIAWMSEVKLRDGSSAIRACITSYRTQASDVEHVAREMTRVAMQNCEVMT